MKKIALCFSGQPRHIVKGAELIKNYFSDYDDMDVFIHCWWSEEMIDKKLINSWGWETSEKISKNHLDIIKDVYNPVIFHPESPIENFDCDYSKRKQRSCVDEEHPYYHNFNSGYTGKYRVNELKKLYERDKGFEYDIVINTRFDLGVSTFFSFASIEKNQCYIPMWNAIRKDKYSGINIDKLSKKYLFYGLHDHIGFGCGEVMDIYSDAINKVDFLLDNTDVPYHPEMLMQKNLEYNNIFVNTLLPLRWVLIRR